MHWDTNKWLLRQTQSSLITQLITQWQIIQSLKIEHVEPRTERIWHPVSRQKHSHINTHPKAKLCHDKMPSRSKLYFAVQIAVDRLIICLLAKYNGIQNMDLSSLLFSALLRPLWRSSLRLQLGVNQILNTSRMTMELLIFFNLHTRDKIITDLPAGVKRNDLWSVNGGTAARKSFITDANISAANMIT